MRYVSPREFFSRLTLVFLAAFVFLFPTMLANAGLGGYFCLWLSPFLALSIPPYYSAGRFWTFYFFFTTNAAVLALMLWAGTILYAWSPRLTRIMCYVAGLLSGPLGLIAVYVGWRRAEEAGLPPIVAGLTSRR